MWGQTEASTRGRNGVNFVWRALYHITHHTQVDLKFITWVSDCARTIIMDQVILTASAPISGSHSASLLFHDISTGTSLASFKQSTSAKHSTALIRTTPAQGGLILAVQPDKALLNVYSFQKVLLYIQTHSICDLTFLVLRIKSPSKPSSQNVFPA